MTGLARWLSLLLRMLRYRVALMLWLFLLLAAASHGGIELSWPRLVLAAISLAGGYVAATTVNDLADREIDAINHPGDPGRPLISGEMRASEALVLHGVGGAIAVAAALPLGVAGAGVAVVSLLIGRAYSLPPLRISYRTYLAPLLLAVGYVFVPYALGLVTVRGHPSPVDAVLAGSLGLLFLARIVLKDFRDRPGDSAGGRPTLLLRHGRDVTCAVSLTALVAGDVLLMAALRPGLAAGLLMQTLVGAIVSRLHALRSAEGPRAEQLAIGLGARMGNALLIAALAVMVLRAEGASPGEVLLLLGVIAAVAWAGFLAIVSRPERAVIAYKG